MGQLPRGDLAGGAVQAFGNGDVGWCWRHAGESFTVEGVGCCGDVEVVGVAAACDVDVGFGTGGGGVDAAGRDVSG